MFRFPSVGEMLAVVVLLCCGTLILVGAALKLLGFLLLPWGWFAVPGVVAMLCMNKLRDAL